MKKTRQAIILKLIFILPALISGLILSQAYPAYADTITVTTTSDSDTADGDCSLREAIIAANTDAVYNGCTPGSGDDSVDLSALNGTITLSSHLPIITRTVQFNGPASGTLTIDGLNTFNAIDSTGTGVNIGVDRLVVTNVSGDGIYATSNITATNSTIVASGCGILAANGSALVSNSQITGQTCDGVAASTMATITDSSITAAVDGVYVDFGQAQITSTTISAGEDGVDVFSDAIVTGSIITATNNGIYAFDGNAEVLSSTITSLTDDGVDADVGYARVTDSAVFGHESGVDTDTGPVEVTNSRVIGNEDGINAVGNATVISSTVTGNTLAGIWTDANATISFSTVSGNQDGVSVLNSATIAQSTISGSSRHGIQSRSQQTISVGFSTIVNNGGYGIMNSTGANLISHTIIAQNGGQGSIRDINGSLSASSSYNLIGNGDGAGVSNGVNGNLSGTSGALLNPKLGVLTNNGGNTQTHALLFGSPALDAIPASSCTATSDQRGQVRPYGNNCDIGAYEAQSSPGMVLFLPLVIK